MGVTERVFRALLSWPDASSRIVAKLVNGMRRTVSALLLGTLVAASTVACSEQQYADGSGSITMSITTSTTSANTPTDSTPASLSGHPVCATDGLAISFGPASTAMNYVYQTVDFTNTSAHTCAMSGFPTISFAVDNGQPVGTPAAQDGTPGDVVILHHGQVASAQLAIADPGIFATDLCQPAAVDGLRVYPPGATTAMYLARPGIACSATPPSPQLKVQAVKSGAS